MFERFKVIIVDDEESSRELIRLSMDWEDLNFDIIGEASNAEEALEIIESNPPDLVLTDIYMPYMNGIELSERILAQYPDMKIIVITGHDDFEYAQRGIKAGVYDFIVKPIDEDEIEHTIKKAYNQIKEEREQKANYGWLEDQLKKELPYLKEKFLIDLLQSHMEEQDFLRRKKFTKINEISSVYQITMIEIIPIELEEQNKNQQGPYLSYMFIESIKTILEDLVGVEVFIDNTNNIIILNTNKDTVQDMNKRIETIKRRILSHVGINLMIGIGGWYEGFNKIKLSYKEALEAVSYKIVSGTNQIITYEDLVISKPSPTGLDETWENKLSIYIKSGIVDESLTIIDKVFNQVMHQENIELKSLRLKAVQLLMVITNAVVEIGINIEDKKMASESAFEEVFHSNSLPDIKLIISSFIEDVCKEVNHEHLNKQNSIIDKINFYIEEHIKETLSLNIISEIFHLNKSYLSRIYKERTGKTLGESILELRMEKAISLLKFTDKKAYEIAAELGYLDPNYFGNSFKKYTGKSISEFRKVHRQ